MAPDAANSDATARQQVNAASPDGIRRILVEDMTRVDWAGRVRPWIVKERGGNKEALAPPEAEALSFLE
jgi:hypothetical protein